MKKLFTNDKFFLAMTLCAVIGELFIACYDIFALHHAIQSELVLILRVACVVVLYISYKKHMKNVMKGMMGALLMAQVITAVLYLSDMQPAMDRICVPIFVVLSVLLFINHFIINADRSASPAMITISQIILVLLTINNTVWDIAWFMFDDFFIVYFLDFIGFAGMISAVVCVESRLDAYRLDREAAGWTEEKGYPEGYVHEYEKK